MLLWDVTSRIEDLHGPLNSYLSVVYSCVVYDDACWHMHAL